MAMAPAAPQAAPRLRELGRWVSALPLGRASCADSPAPSVPPSHQAAWRPRCRTSPPVSVSGFLSFFDESTVVLCCIGSKRGDAAGR